jgi:hypothetical protein
MDLLVGAAADSTVWLFENRSGGDQPVLVPLDDFDLDAHPFAALAVGDLDGDGRPEILSGGIGGGFLYFKPIER